MSVHDLGEAEFRRTLEEIQQAGLQVLSSSFELGFITGEAAPEDLPKIKSVQGVDNAHISRTLHIVGAA